MRAESRGRASAATITVNSTSNVAAGGDGLCTLREAITNANSNTQLAGSVAGDCPAGMAGLDTIEFNLGTGTPSIGVTDSALPAITEPVIINGNTGGATRVELTRVGAVSLANGLTITAGGSTIQALVINGFNVYNIYINGAGGNTISNCFIGTDVTGTLGFSGNSINGVFIDGAPNNTIGGTTASERNLISNNGVGVNISGTSATGNKVSGNFIGTDINGTADRGNVVGVYIYNAPNNIIGGATSGERNLISGSEFYGVHINSTGAAGNKVSGNYIGTDVTGTLDLGNNLDGVLIDNGAPNNVVGGTTAGERNLISGNNQSGVVLYGPGNKVSGNFIGTDVTGANALGNNQAGVVSNQPNNVIGGTTVGERNLISGNKLYGVGIGGATDNKVIGNYIGTDINGTADLGNSFDGVRIFDATNNTIGGTSAAESNLISGNDWNGVFIFATNTTTTGNRVLGNSISNNTLLGINLAPLEANANDQGDPDSGPNNLQNFPALTSVTSNGSTTTVTGTLNSTANRSFTIQFFANTICDGSGHGEGQFFLGQTTVMTDGSGNAAINATLIAAAPNGSFITATATDADGNTSEFSACVTASGPACGYVIAPTNQSFAANGGSGNFSITPINGCAWTATSNDPSWITITSGSGGSGNGTVNYTVAAHANPTTRSGTITLTGGLTFTVLQGAQFLDVPVGAPFYTEIGKLSARGVTLGCGGGNYCPASAVTREQMAAFIMRALGDFNPPPPTLQRYNDVPPENLFYAFIEQMAVKQITLGCQSSPPLYCPASAVTREQMAAFIIRALHTPGYVPPAPAMQRFADVPPSNPFYGHIEELAVRAITLGCGGGNYCPLQNVTRAQMAAFLVRAFNL